MLTLILVVLISGCKKDDYKATVGVCPLVVSTIPANGAVKVPLNQVISATFNEKMNATTITSSTFTVVDATKSAELKAAVIVAGAITYSGTTASFTPSSPLSPSTTYTGRMTSAAKDLMGNALQTDYVWTFSTDVPPTVTTNPSNNAVDVPLNQIVIATFSVPMDSLTLKLVATSFTLKQGTTGIPGKFLYTSNTVSFVPTIALAPFTTYTGTITTAAKNVLGTPLAADYVWNFITIPQLTLSSNPALGGTTSGAGTFAQGSSVTVVATATLGYSFLNWTNGTTVASTSASYQFAMAGNKTLVANFTPKYSVTVLSNPVLGGTTSGGGSFNPGASVTVTAVSNAGFTFTNWTEGTTVVSTSATYLFTISANRSLVANYAAASGFSVTVSSNPLLGGTTSGGGTFNSGVSVTVTALANTGYTFTNWTEGTNIVSPLANYTFTITSNRALVANYSSSVPSSPLVNLNSAGRFGILSGVGISNNAGFSVINNMDVGISPGARSSVTGFPPATVVGGAIYASDDIAPPGTPAMLTQAKLDLTAAYLFAEGATAPAPVTVSGDQGGKTLAPGIYKSTSTLLIQAGDLTLDGQGDPNATWIFQVASAFTTVGGAGGNVILTGGAQAKNIFWQTGSSAVIGDYTTFYGNVLALQSITMNSHATAVGRMLARNGAVVLTGTNIINKP